MVTDVSKTCVDPTFYAESDNIFYT